MTSTEGVMSYIDGLETARDSVNALLAHEGHVIRIKQIYAGHDWSYALIHCDDCDSDLISVYSADK
jgi:hypothetical protein